MFLGDVGLGIPNKKATPLSRLSETLTKLLRFYSLRVALDRSKIIVS